MPFGRHGVPAASPSKSKRSIRGASPHQPEMMMQPAEMDFQIHATPVLSTDSRNTPKSEILSITDKIANALNEFDRMYDENEDTEMLNEVSEQLNSMENGPLKYQLKEFVNKYKDVTSQVGEAQSQRTEILESLSDWFADHEFENELGKLSYEDDEISNDDREIRDGLLSTKMTFDKLKRLNAEIAEKQSLGRDVEELEREKNMISAKAVSDFKNYKTMTIEKKKEQERTATPDLEVQAWKHAAGEIVGLLGRVRNEGTDYIAELEEKVKEMVKKINDTGNEITRQKNKIREFQLIEKKWQDDNVELTEAKARKAKKIKRLRHELRNMHKSLAKYEKVTAPSVLDEDEHEDEKEKDVSDSRGMTFASAAPAEPVGLTSRDPAILAARLKDHKKQLKECTKEKEELERTVEAQNLEIEDKDDIIMRLEHDKSELIHQMKQASVRPNKRNLSDMEPIGSRLQSSSRHLAGASVVGISGIHLNVAPEKPTLCHDCGKSINESSHHSIDIKSPRNEKPDHAPPSKTVKKAQKKFKESKNSTVSKEADKASNEAQNEEIKNLKKQCKEYKAKIQRLKDEVKSAKQAAKEKQAQAAQGDNEKYSRKSPSPRVIETNVSSPQPTFEEDHASHEELPPVSPTSSHSIVLDFDESTEEATEEEVIDIPERHIDSPFDLENPHHHKDIEIHTTPEFAYKKDKAAVEEDQFKEFVNRGMQTDPKLDPLGAWSAAVPDKQGWRPPMPPAKWLEFDPTAPTSEASSHDVEPVQAQEATTGAHKRMSIAQQMMSGVDPSDIRQEALHCTTLVQKELERMTQGIQGFIEYTNSLLDREARLMGIANKQLTGHLSHSELHKLEKDLERPMTSNLAGKRQDHLDEESYSNILSQFGPDTARERRGSRLGSITTTDSIEEFEKLRENMLPVEERVKHQVNKIGQDVIATLERTHGLVFNALQGQHREYEKIFTTLQSRPQSIAIKAEPDIIEDKEKEEEQPFQFGLGASLGPRRSRSHSILHIPRKSLAVDHDGLQLTGSRSNIQLPERKPSEYLAHDEVEIQNTLSKFFDKPAIKQSATNKDKMDIATAGLTKKGQILLTTTHMKNADMPLTKAPDKVARKVRPAPLSHQKLIRKQNELFGTGGNLSNNVMKPKRKGPPQNHVLTDYQLPTDFFGNFTVNELEKRALQFASNEKKVYHESNLEKIHFPSATKSEGQPRRKGNSNRDTETFPHLYF